MKDTKNQYRAIKIIPKSKVKDPERFLNEINIMKQLDHPNKTLWKFWRCQECIFGYGVFFNIYILRVCEGGELFDRIIDKGHYSETEARTVFT